ncbi:MAG: hypothetical protein ABIZ34_08580 [Candidatus Limnocylindrales bacterium]
MRQYPRMGTNQDWSHAAPPDPDTCLRCGQPLTLGALPGDLCEQCQEDDRNLNFIDVEMSTWQEQQEQEANDNEL